MGYGSRTLELLAQYYEGQLTSVDEEEMDTEEPSNSCAVVADGSGLLHETIAPRTNMPPLLQDLADRAPEELHYIGTRCGEPGPLR